MTYDEAIAMAISALENERDDTYEGDELDEPEIIAWMDKRTEAIKQLKRMRQYNHG